MKKKNDNAAVLMELNALTNVYATLKNVGGTLTALQTTEDLINKKLAQVQ